MKKFEIPKHEPEPLEPRGTSFTQEVMLTAREALKKQIRLIAEKNLETRQGSGRVPLVPKLGEDNPSFNDAEKNFAQVYGENFYDEMRIIGDEIEKELGITPEKS